MFGFDQILALGLTPRAVHSRAAAGRLHRIHQKVYSLVPRELLKREGLYMAAVLADAPDAVLSHRSAGALHRLRDWGHTKIEITVPRRSARRHEGTKVHRSTTLTGQDVTVVNNIPCTSVARTLLDLGEVVTGRQLERSFDQAELAEVLDLKATEDQLARNATRPGAKWHTSSQRFEINRQRDQRLVAAGWRVIRTTWRQMKFRPHELRRVLIELLAPAGAPTSSVSRS